MHFKFSCYWWLCKFGGNDVKVVTQPKVVKKGRDMGRSIYNKYCLVLCCKLVSAGLCTSKVVAGKIVSEMSYGVSSGTLNPTAPWQTILSCFSWCWLCCLHAQFELLNWTVQTIDTEIPAFNMLENVATGFLLDYKIDWHLIVNGKWCFVEK